MLWLLVEIAVGLGVAGVLAPLTLRVLPRNLQGPWTLGVTALIAVAAVMLLRRGLFDSGSGKKPTT